MTLIKGSFGLTRYRVLDAPADINPEFLAERLRRTAFLDIDHTVEEESLGWVEILDHLSSNFDPLTFHFGPVAAMGLRLDRRKVPAKVLNRYLALAEAEASAQKDGPLSSEERRKLKNRVRHDLLARTPVTTDVFEVCWFLKEEEVWLVGSGTQARERFEDQWRRTFNLGLTMKIPYLLARELVPVGLSPEVLDQIKPAALWGGKRA